MTKVKQTPKYRIFEMCDHHMPYHDKDVYKLLLKAIAEFRPDKIILNGDTVDFYAASFHRKDPTRKADLESEIEAVNLELDKLDVLAKSINAEVIFIEGNHEYRFHRYLVDKAPELFGMTNCKKLLRIADRGWKWVGYKDFYTLGKMSWTHDLDRSGKYCTFQSLADFGGNVVIGHSHRLGVAYSGNITDGVMVCKNIGWGGDGEEIDYKHKAKVIRDWQHGFGTTYIDWQGNAFTHVHPVVNGRCCIEGKVISL